MNPAENERLRDLCRIEDEIRSRGIKLIAGIDEVGRGPLAGPVVAAAVVFTEPVLIQGVNDSKLLSAKRRQEIYRELTRNSSIHTGIGIISESEIDRINILESARKAMIAAVLDLPLTPEIALVDGTRVPALPVPQRPIIGGDALCYSIAAASIIAKVVRDSIMDEYDSKYPEYGFKSHKGYGTKKHLENLRRFGPCKIHRRSFAPVASLIQSRNRI